MNDGFSAAFGRAPEATASAPGRVNLLGEHTDYNDGYVLPIALAHRTTVAVGPAGGSRFALQSDSLAQRVDFDLAARPESSFARYVYGCLKEAEARGVHVPPADIHVASDVPMEVGLSSSAALEVATLRVLREWLQAPFSDIEIAQMAQRAEIVYAGVRCGIMDQMASSLADTTHALFLDTRTLATRRVSLPAGTAVLVLDSGVPRALASSAFNERRRECEEACVKLGVPSLRDVADPGAVETLAEPWRRRARHVVTENLRVLEAVAGADAAAFGRLMNASHASLRDDYEVSVPALDRLVALLQAHDAVHGARLTGAGFGGACVALCDAGCVADVSRDVLARYAAGGDRGRQLSP